MKKLLIFVCILLTLCSCSYATMDSEHSDDITTSESNQAASDSDSLEEVSELYPDKTILVWTVEGYVNSMRTMEINEYLNGLGCDFAVCFLPLQDDEMFKTTSHIKLINEMLIGNRQLDIISSGSISIGIDDCTNSYHSLVEDGILIPLDDYLSGTEIGKKLYSLMPEKHWEGLKTSGHIYGVDGSMNTLSYYTGYSVDKTIADEYGFDVTVSPLEQLDILAEIAKDHPVCFFQSFNIPEIYTSVYSITSATYWDDSQNKAKCILENEGFLRNLEIYYTLKENGFVSEYNSGSPFIFFEGNRHGFASSIAENRYCQFDSTVYICPTWSATGISANSKYPDKAFELLALAQTDPYLNNLLVYGVEGEDYTLADGRVDSGNYFLRTDVFANKLICLPDKYSPINISDIYRKALENAELPSCNGFALHERDIIETITKTNFFFTLNEFSDILNSDSYESFEAMIKTAREKLDTYGVNELTDEINRQYEEWKKVNEN